MVGFLLEAKAAACVKEAFATILARLAELYGGDNGRIFGTYMELFEILLGDLGGEFTGPLALECPAGAVSGDLDPRLVEMFYCDPYRAWQKAFVECNHEFVRYVLPKATHYTEAASFDGLTQSDVELLMSHINRQMPFAIGGTGIWYNICHGQDDQTENRTEGHRREARRCRASGRHARVAARHHPVVVRMG